MSRLSMEELMKSLKEEREKRAKEKKLVITLDEMRYKKLITAIIIANNGEQEVYETFKKVTTEVIDKYLDEIDFYDLTEEDMDSLVEVFEELV